MDAQSAGQSPQQHNGIDVNEKAKHHPSRLVNNSAQISKSVPPRLHSSYAFFDDYVADTVTAVPHSHVNVPWLLRHNSSR